MEFMYRAGDERRSPSSPPSPVPTSPSSSAGGQPADADDETRRQAEKATIQERILREETVGRFELELEVRLDLIERFRQTSAMNEGGPEPPALPSPLRAPKADSRVIELAALLTKRKSPVHGAPSNAPVETSGKKQKLSLICTLCGITANAEKAMQDHLKGKGHKRKAEAQPTTEPEAEEEDAVFTARSGDFKPTKFTMVTNKGTVNQVTQMDGYILCEVCNVRSADRVTMMCHLEGAKHISKAAKETRQATREATAGIPPMQKNASGRSSEQQDTMATWADIDVAAVKSTKAPGTEEAKVRSGPLTVGDLDLDMEADGVRHPLRRVKGFLLCPCCDVKAHSDIVMRSHLTGKKHKNKVKSAEAGVGASVAATLGYEEQGDVPNMSRAGGDAGSEAPTSINAAAAVAPTELDAPAEVVSVITPTEPADDTTKPCGKPFKMIQVEGKLLTVQQQNGRFSCELCGVFGCNKDAMVKHLYRSLHWEKASLAETKEDLARAAEARN